MYREEIAVLSIVLAFTGCGGKTRTGEGTAVTSDGECAPIPDLTPAELLDPSCPAGVPEIGAACDRFNLVCAYERCLTAGKSDVVFICNRGSFFWEDDWDCEPNSFECPACLPTPGSPCPRIGEACRYGPGVKAGCWAEGWHVWVEGARDVELAEAACRLPPRRARPHRTTDSYSDRTNWVRSCC